MTFDCRERRSHGVLFNLLVLQGRYNSCGRTIVRELFEGLLYPVIANGETTNVDKDGGR